MIGLERNGPERGDCTASYSVNMIDKTYTVLEFIDEVLARDKEWGYIGFYNPDNPEGRYYGSPRLEYEHGRLITPVPYELLGKNVISATADGGWTAMDYLLKLEADIISSYITCDTCTHYNETPAIRCTRCDHYSNYEKGEET